MYFVILGTDKPGVRQQRLDTIDEVATYVRDRPGHSGINYYCGGPTLDEEGNITGTIIIIDAPSLEAAQAFMDDNPLQKMGLLDKVEIRQFDWKTGRPD
ncbi:MAG: YciI family protein [Paracoccaceae bacterium]|nr:YciI family protein [Paracoccaceae bacterium]MDE2760096.1 YciI family protein [Paracoccaceae bacterium]MDE2916453.1 YciI family protein [Paracoccaceae bacterium]